MPEQIYTFSDEEIARMFKSGDLKLLASPVKSVQKELEKTAHEKALEKARELFGSDDFEDVQVLNIGGKSLNQLKQELQEANVYITGWATALLERLDLTPSISQNIETVKLRVEQLGFNGITTTNQIYRRAKELGLQLCSAEIGLCLRVKDTDQPLRDQYWITLKPIADNFWLFGIMRNEMGLLLDCLCAGQDSPWYPSNKFIFSLPQ